MGLNSLAMKTEIRLVSDIKPNEQNPRKISKDKFEKLKKSVSEFPKMLELRPLVVDGNGVVIGGNMRLKVAQELGIKELKVVCADDLSPEEIRRFVILDNTEFGEYDFEMLSSLYDAKELLEWGVDADELGGVEMGTDDESIFEAKNILEIVPPEYPVLKDRIQINIKTIEKYREVKEKMEKDPLIMQRIKEILGL